MQFEDYGTRFVFVMASFSSRYSVASFDCHIVYLSLYFNMLLSFHHQFLLLQLFQFSSYFSKNRPLSSINFPLFCINDRVYFLHGFESLLVM